MVYLLMIGFIGMFIHRYKLFKLLVSYSIAAMGLNLFFVLGGNIHFDINVLLFSSLLWGLEAAETAVVLFLFIVTANCLAIINIKLLFYMVTSPFVQRYTYSLNYNGYYNMHMR